MTLGCAETYRAAIHAQGGGGLWTRIGGLTEVTWSRKLDDWSEATVDIAKADAGQDCCGKLGDTRTWGHELSLYRDDEQEPCWQGPILIKSEKRHSLKLTARDMLFWFERRGVSPAAGDSYFWPTPTDTGEILRTVIEEAFADADPGLLEYADLEDTDTMSTLDRLWRDTDSVGDVVRELIVAGVDVYTVGRRVYVVSDRANLGHTPYRLDETAFLDELEVRENGIDAATRGICVGGQPLDGGGQPIQDVSPVVGTAGGTDPFYGRIDRFTSSPNTVVESVADGIAGAIRSYGHPPPVDLIVPSGARLSPAAPVTINQLIPGRLFMVGLRSYCTAVQRLFRLNELDVTWAKTEVEKVAVSLAGSGPVQEVA